MGSRRPAGLDLWTGEFAMTLGMAALGVAVVAGMGLFGYSRARARRRFDAVLNAYAEREMLRNPHGKGAHKSALAIGPRSLATNQAAR